MSDILSQAEIEALLSTLNADANANGGGGVGGSKPAKINTGATISVPLFINTGEKVRVDIQKGEYLSRFNE